MFKSRLIIPQFPIPNTWVKLQEPQYIQNQALGIPDKRVDCCINVFAFIGVIKRECAEELSVIVNAENKGVNSNDAAAYMEIKGGYEKSPHGITSMSTTEEVLSAFSHIKENCASIIGLTRKNGTGHAATVVRIQGKLMVFDPQLEILFSDIAEWLDNENAISVNTIQKLNKIVHCRDEATVCIHKQNQNEPAQKCQKIEEKTPSWKIKNFAKSRERNILNARREFVENMIRAGFVNLLD